MSKGQRSQPEEAPGAKGVTKKSTKRENNCSDQKNSITDFKNEKSRVHTTKNRKPEKTNI